MCTESRPPFTEDDVHLRWRKKHELARIHHAEGFKKQTTYLKQNTGMMQKVTPLTLSYAHRGSLIPMRFSDAHQVLHAHDVLPCRYILNQDHGSRNMAYI
jgi:hypothetical protein